MSRKSNSLFLKFSFLLPLIMSVAGLFLIFGHLAVYGIVRETDEGLAAHLWQLLMAGQIPFLAYFSIVHLPNQPVKSLKPFLILIFFWVANFTSLFYLERRL